jgi:adenylosuccinate synthase
MVKEAIILNGITELAMMKLDVLDGLKKIRLCTGYVYKGKLFKEFPRDFTVLTRARPVYQEIPGWRGPINKVCRLKALPLQARDYLAILEDILQVKFSIISVGSSRAETIFIKR